MMETGLNYWQSWQSQNRFLFYLLACLALLALGLMTWVILGSESAVSHYALQTEVRTAWLQAEPISSSLGPIPLADEIMLLYQKAEVSIKSIDPLFRGIYFAFFMAFLSIGLAVASKLSKIYFYLAMAALLFYFAFVGLENLNFPYDTGYLLFIISCLFFISPAYYFFAFKPKTKLPKRILTFLVISAIYTALLLLTVPSRLPIVHLLSYSSLWLCFSVLIFSFIVGFDLIYAFLILSTSSTSAKPGRRVWLFSSVSIIYLLNLLLLYLKNTKVIELEIIYVHAFLVLGLSGIAGIWGVWFRRTLSSSIMPVGSLQLFWYLSWMCFSFLTIIYFYLSAQDSILEVLEDGILYTHLSLGVLFLLYVLRNFSGAIAQNLKAWQVAYQPRTWPFIMVRGAAAIAILAFIFKSNYYGYFQMMAGYNNALADMHLERSEYHIAETYYQSGAIFDNFNQKSNFALAEHARRKAEPETAAAYLERSIKKQGTAEAYLELSNTYLKLGKTLEAHLSLQDGLEKYPDHPGLQLNAGLTSLSLQMIDSALVLFEKSGSSAFFSEASKINIASLAIEKGFAKEAKELVQHLKPGLKKSSLQCLIQPDLNVSPPADWEAADQSSRHAFLINTGKRLSKVVPNVNRLIAKEQELDSNGLYSDLLALASLSHALKSGRVLTGLEVIGTQDNFGNAALGPLYYQTGLHFLRAGSYDLALDFFKKTELLYDAQARMLRFYLELLCENKADSTLLPDPRALPLAQQKEWQNQCRKAITEPDASPEAGWIHKIKSSETDRRLPIKELENRRYSDGFILEKAVLGLDRGDFSLATEWLEAYQVLGFPENTRLIRLQNELRFLTYGDTLAAKALRGTNGSEDSLQARRLAPGRMVSWLLDAEKLKERGNKTAAYEVLIEGLRISPNDFYLHQRYALTCLEIGLSSYADHSLALLKEKMKAADYHRFEQIYTSRKQLVEKEKEKW
jgi:hypothetical protein